MPQDYYLQAAEMQGIRVDVTDGILSVRLPALLPKKTRAEGFKFLQPALHAALKQYAEQQSLHFREWRIRIEHVYDRCLPIKAVRDYDNLEMKEVLDIITLYCMTDDTGTLCDQFQTTRFSDSSLHHHFRHAKRKIFCMAGYEKSCKIRKKLTSISSKKILQKFLLAHLGGFSVSQSPFRHSKRKRCTEDNVPSGRKTR